MDNQNALVVITSAVDGNSNYCPAVVPFHKKLIGMCDLNGDGAVSSTEASNAAAVFAPGKTADEHKVISAVALQIIEGGNSDRPNTSISGLFRPEEKSVSVSTCNERLNGQSAICTDSKGDGSIDRSEAAENQNALVVITSAVDGISNQHPVGLNLPYSSLSSDTFWKWRSATA